ncbi:tape measure domain-containing protein [Mycetocola sp. BIGb0189]|uniref:tape measure protein n=1 Tax=Mycetocola sp. BIGb0189 TaxID=2940604 RepID=UPI002166FDCA|nr:tape measure protein [Mycetocola sp. BIGb0189]MCS4275340.1 tape measure domain-containing protein [Mycetocola sp. BIGb0189]
MAEAAVAEVSLIIVSKGAGKQIADEIDKDDPGTKAGKSVGDKVLGGIGKALKGGALAVGAVAVGGIGTALVKGFSRLDGIDQAKAKLTGLGHSGESVQLIMDNALASVKGTAFGLAEAGTSAANAVAAGVKPGAELERTLKLVADASTIAGTGMGEMGAIFNKAAASNKVQMDVINQLHDAGVPALAFLADQMGVTAEEASKMASAGKIDFATFQDAMEKGLGGAAASSGDTFKGALDNMGAAMGRLGADLLSGIFPELKNGFGDLTTLFDDLGPVAKDVGKAIGETAKAVGEGIKDLVSGLTMNKETRDQFGDDLEGLVKVGADVRQAFETTGDVIKNVFEWVQSNSSWLTPLAVGAAAGAAAFTVWTLAVKGWAAATSIADKVQKAFDATTRASVIGLIVTAVVALVSALIWFFTETDVGKEIWANFTKFLGEAWDNIVAGFQAVVDFFVDAWNNIANFFSDAIDNIVSFVQDHWGLLLSFLIGPMGLAIQWIVEHWEEISDFFVSFYNDTIKPIFDGIGEVFTWLYENIVVPFAKGLEIHFAIMAAAAQWLYDNAIKPAFDGIGWIFNWLYENVVKRTFDGIGIIFTWIKDNVFTPFADFVKTTIEGVGAIFTWLYENAIQPAFDLIGAIFEWIYENVILRIFNGWVEMINGVGAIFTWLYENAIQPAFDLIGAIFEWIYENVILRVFNGWVEMINGVGAIFTWLYENAVQPALDGIGKGMQWVQDTIIAPVSKGITDLMNGIGETVDDVFGAIPGFMESAFKTAKDLIKAPINGIIDLINGAIGGINSMAIDVPDWFPGDLGGKTIGFNIPKIPRLAEGGIISKQPGGILANIGEGKYDEAVVPLNRKFYDALSGSASSERREGDQITVMASPGMNGTEFAHAYAAQREWEGRNE